MFNTLVGHVNLYYACETAYPTRAAGLVGSLSDWEPIDFRGPVSNPTLIFFVLSLFYCILQLI